MAASLPRARQELRDLLALCRAVEERRRSPFDVDLGEARGKVSELFPVWTELEDLRLDAAVLHGLARVVQIQESRLRYEAGLFLADPQLLGDKIARIPSEDLANAFLASWHPIVELQQVTARGLEQAKRYFDALRPWSERRTKASEGRPPEARRMTEEDLVAMGVLSHEGFLAYLGELWEELKGLGPTEYHAFVGRGDRARRAYGVAFLISYGYADLRQEDGDLVLTPREERTPRAGVRSAVIVLGGGP